MRIQHNIMAMSAYRNYTNNVAAMKKNLEKLSSGYKINRAGDDAAGLAISEKMRAQITGLETAQKNAKDGISLVQTAEGALTEVHDMLNRMVELATMSANGTYDNTTDRAQLQKEVDQLRSEINRIADSANFNGIKLLDGSMDADGGVAAVEKNFTIPPEGNDMYTNTILNKKDGGAQASFKVELHNADYEPIEGETMRVTVGNNTFDLTITSTNKTKGLDELIVDAITSGTPGEGGEAGKINGVGVTATANGTNVSFVADSDNVFDADLSVKIDILAPENGYDPQVATAAVDATKIATLVTTAPTVAVGAVVNNGTLAGTFDKDDINTAIKALGLTVTSSSAFVIEGKGSSGFTLKVGGQTLATATITAGSIASGASKAIKFTYGEADTSLGTLTLTAGGGAVAATAVEGLTLNANGGTIKDVSINAIASDTIGSAAQAAIASAAGTTAQGKVTIGATTGGTLKVYVGDASIGTATVGTNKLTVTVGTTTFDIDMTNLPAGATDADVADMLGSTKIDLGVTVTLPTENPVKGTFNEFTTENTSGTNGIAGQPASTTFELGTEVAKVGAEIRIGNSVYTIAEGDKNELSGTTIKVTKELLAEGGDKLRDMVGELLSRDAGNTDFTIGYDKTSNRVSVHEKLAANGDLMDHTWDVEGGGLDTIEGFEKLLGFGTPLQKGKGLTLQIGDTADSYNKLTVNISDMHTAAMGIGDISVATQEDAAKAVDAIKAAINYVSDVRGTLGATQNRLDHTINNLSVMTENIQDAESTIRDVDVAEEMMAYTKNNILIQSAQAMLAQANQVPQGVLQLLQ